jgi:hypothetical protein
MMKMYENLKLGESCHFTHFVSHTGLMIDETHLAVQVCMRNADKYKILENIDQMLEEVEKNQSSIRVHTLRGQAVDGAEIALKLDDLRRWFITEYCYDIMENCNKVIELQRSLAEKENEKKKQQEEMKKQQQEWEKEKEKIAADIDAMNKKDEWANRVTYDNVVEQIASLEDASKRDDARRVFEPLLKKNQVAQLRKDVKLRVKQMNEESNGPTINAEKVEVNGPMYEISGNKNVNIGNRNGE